MIARIWRGAVRTADGEGYIRYIQDTGIAEYEACSGNCGAWLLSRDLGDGRTEILTLSFWENRDSIREFAGEDIERAVFYPEDERYLLERDLTVTHYEIAGARGGEASATDARK
jgi:heme-degrading monooxygenase HmoA